MSEELERPHAVEAIESLAGGLSVCTVEVLSLGSLPVGARLILRCRKDWRDATVANVSTESITLSVISPTGRTYRVRRPPDSPLSFDGEIPLLGEGHWRTGLARYDARW